MKRILPNIKEDAKVTVLDSVVSEGIARPLIKFEVSAGRMKYVSVTNNNLNNENNNVPKEPIISKPETNISSAPIVYISDIKHASPRQFFERFLPVEYIMSTVISFTNEHARASERLWKNLTWMEFIQFRDIIKYLKLTDMDKIDKSPFQRKIPRKPHPIDYKFKTVADVRVNLLVQLDPCESPEHANKKKFSEYSATIATTSGNFNRQKFTQIFTSKISANF
ncbi:hypothetical protein Glove_156g109 [Diversispora epigaea]|uniref:PiggyBac transposable element-derived protein domain-containing protein n=1 Tax=Diversispora epigaea TaxID=1348612 RepID=A0A397J1M4_9GLOM|nr:hypothetical protein Glove_156g109 [Diversispora epigaea]